MYNYYLILGVAKNAIKEDIKSAFKTKSNFNHPDKFSDSELKKQQEIEMMKILEAYNVLSDDSKRKIHDEYLSEKGVNGNEINNPNDKKNIEVKTIKKENKSGNVNFDRKIKEVNSGIKKIENELKKKEEQIQNKDLEIEKIKELYSELRKEIDELKRKEKQISNENSKAALEEKYICPKCGAENDIHKRNCNNCYKQFY
jgi:DnaJ-class molecular chaperone